MFNKLLNFLKKETPASQVRRPFGRYSDNNKTVEKINSWNNAEDLFKEKKPMEAIDAFFQYLRDDNAQNVHYERNGNQGNFTIAQGSKIIKGLFNDKSIEAEAVLVKMSTPSVAVMRRLLEMNFNHYYSRFGLNNELLTLRFTSDITSINANKLYYSFKEVATKADKQDDLLLDSFASLTPVDQEHIIPASEEEKAIKLRYFQNWINEVLNAISGVDTDKFSGGISYLLLSLVYRIDFLIVPEGKLLHDLEKIPGLYYRKEEVPATEKNRDMIDAFKKLLNISQEDFYKSMYKSTHTFSIVSPQNFKSVADSIRASNEDMVWYKDNNYPFWANQLIEYGISYCQYSYSMPSVVSDLFNLFMEINYGDYYRELGYNTALYNSTTNRFDQAAINQRIKQIQAPWTSRFKLMDFRTINLKYDSLNNFNKSFTTEIEFLNLDNS